MKRSNDININDDGTEEGKMIGLVKTILKPNQKKSNQ